MDPGTYTLTGAELSMFTRKLEAQLRYQNIPHQWRFKSMTEAPELEKRARTRFYPPARDPRWLADQ